MRGVIAAAVVGIAVLATLFVWRTPGGREAVGPARIGVVQLTAVDAQTFEGLKAGLAELGFPENLKVQYDFEGPAESIERLPGIIDGVLSRGADLVVVSSTPATQAVVKVTRDRGLPVVFAPVNDPVAAGVVPDLTRPGGTVTGIRLPAGDDLRLDWLRRIVPGVEVVVMPHVPTDKSSTASVEIVAKAASAIGIKVVAEPVKSCAEAAAAVTRHAGRADAVFLPRDSFVESCIDDLVRVANQLRIPVAAPSLTQVGRGALMSYGFVHFEIGRRAAHLTAQVLRGVPPGDLPVEAAENYLAINTAAASAIGLLIPEDILVLADIIKRD